MRILSSFRSAVAVAWLALAVSAIDSSPAHAALTATALVSSQNPSALGQSVTFTATVTVAGLPIAALGNVTFKDGGATLGTSNVNAFGQATFTTSALSASAHTITAEYNGSILGGLAASTSAPLTQTVSLNASTTSVAASPNPSTFGQSVTLTATVNGSGGTPTGSVTFRDAGASIGTATLSGGQASVSISTLSVGSHSITADYGGDGAYGSSTSSSLSQTVNQNTTSTSLSSSPNPSGLTQSVTFTASVSSSGGTPTGTVSFKDNGVLIGSSSLSGGSATFSTGLLLPGVHTITATYDGNTNFSASTSSPVGQAVNIGTSSTSVVSLLNPSASGQSVTFTATVSGLIVTPTGTITFKDSGTTIGTGTLNGSGQATLAVSLANGSHSITAEYGGDSLYGSSVSAPLSQSVTANASATAISSSANPSGLAQSVTFTATVTSPGGTPTGSVTFKDGGTTIGSGTLAGGVVTFSTSALLPGTHTISASYSGDSNFAASNSPPLSQSVSSGSSTTSLTSSANPSAFGQSVTLTATVAGLGPTPTGTVTFKDGGTTIGTVTLNGGGQAVLNTTALGSGAHSITAVFGGDSVYGASTSAPLSQTVGAGGSATTLTSSRNPALAGQAVTFTATVTTAGPAATGAITFRDGATMLGSASLNSSGQAALSVAALSTGRHDIIAVYGSDGITAASTSSALTQTVNANTSTVTLASSSNPSRPGQSVTFVATVSGANGAPSGTVTFKDGSASFGTAPLANGRATISTASLATGSHEITAVYGGDAAFGGATSKSLTQVVAIPADSLNLRTLQSAATKVVAQSSGNAIAGAMDSAIAEGFSGASAPLTPNGSGLRTSIAAFADEPRTTGSIAGRAADAFTDIQPKLAASHRAQRWLPWAEVRAAAWSSSRTSDMQGNQINAFAGLTHLITPDLLVGTFGGYETFDYRWAAITGQMKGTGLTVGGYAGWRFLPDVRLEAGLAYSRIQYDARAGTAAAAIEGRRWLANFGLAGSAKISGLTLEPSARLYLLHESDSDYTDSLGTAQTERRFTAGRASAGLKASYAHQLPSGTIVTPFAGLYADYVFSRDIGAAVGSPDHAVDWSARVTGGVSLTDAKGRRTSLAAEVGGLGSPLTFWLVRGGLTVPF